MGKEIFGKDLGRFLYCSSLLEERIANAYEHLSKLVDDVFVGGLLSFIARDSLKHAECFRVASEMLSGGIDVPVEACEKVWGETWKTLVVDAERFLAKREIGAEEIASLINGLMKLESFAAEEYLTVMHVKLVESMADESKIDLENLRAVFEWIIEDEKRHEQILKMIEKMLTKRNEYKI
ncbi:MAG: hypothetical protein ACPLRY_01895 [Candidatus Bathyarchaeales archaeon]